MGFAMEFLTNIKTAHELSREEITNRMASLRTQRDAALSETDWMVLRHREEIDSGVATTISDAEYADLLAYRQQLRDWPSAAGWIDSPMPARWVPT